jgi:serine/threonine protein kinase
MLSDFKTKKLLGKGSYGKVYLIERIKNPGEVYAMKCIDKRKILKDNILEST